MYSSRCSQYLGDFCPHKQGFFSHTIDGIFHLPAGVRQSTGAVLAEHTTPTLNLPEGPLEALGIDEGVFLGLMRVPRSSILPAHRTDSESLSKGAEQNRWGAQKNTLDYSKY